MGPMLSHFKSNTLTDFLNPKLLQLGNCKIGRIRSSRVCDCKVNAFIWDMQIFLNFFLRKWIFLLICFVNFVGVLKTLDKTM